MLESNEEPVSDETQTIKLHHIPFAVILNAMKNL